MISEKDASFIYLLHRITSVCECARDMFSEHDEDAQFILAETGYYIGQIVALCDAAADELQGCREKSIRYLLEKDAKIEERQRRADECEKQIREMTEAQNGEAGA